MKKYLLLLVGFLFVSCQSFKIQENQRGVLFKKFGGGLDTTKVFLPGKYRVKNHDRMIVYDISTHKERYQISANSSDQKNIELDISIEFGADPNKIAQIEYFIGNSYPSRFSQTIVEETQVYIQENSSTEIELENNSKFHNTLLEKYDEIAKGFYVEIFKLDVELSK